MSPRVHPIRNFFANVLPCSVIYHHNSRPAQGMNQPNLPTPGSSHRTRSSIRTTLQRPAGPALEQFAEKQEGRGFSPAVDRAFSFGALAPEASLLAFSENCESARRRQPTRAQRPSHHFPSVAAAIFPAAMASSHSFILSAFCEGSQATSHCFFNRQPARLEIVISRRKQRTGTQFNRQHFNGSCSANCAPRAAVYRTPIARSFSRATGRASRCAVHQSPITTHQSRLSCHESRP